MAMVNIIDSIKRAFKIWIQADSRVTEDSSIAKSYLNILVGEIVVKDKDAIIKGSYDSLAKIMYKIKVGDLNNQVPTFISMWRPQGELSKSRPLKSPAPAKFYASELLLQRRMISQGIACATSA
jgi:hypothetical protein